MLCLCGFELYSRWVPLIWGVFKIYNSDRNTNIKNVHLFAISA